MVLVHQSRCPRSRSMIAKCNCTPEDVKTIVMMAIELAATTAKASTALMNKEPASDHLREVIRQATDLLCRHEAGER